jgi:cell division protein FtsB
VLLKKKSGRMYHRNLNFKIIGINLFLFMLIIYFTAHSLSGDRGLFAYFRLKKEITHQAKLLKDLQDQRAQLELQTKLLHPKTLDLDMLDELARRELGMLAPDEKVIYLKN